MKGGTRDDGMRIDETVFLFKGSIVAIGILYIYYGLKA